MDNPISVLTSFKGGFVEAKKLLHAVLTYAVHNAEDDRILDQVFDDPEGTAKRLGGNPWIQLTPEDVEALKKLGRETFQERLTSPGGTDAIQALVNCLERMDMAEVSA